MARLLHTGDVEVGATLGKPELMRAIVALTVDNDRFDPGPWSLYDAEIFEMAARLIRREIQTKGTTT